jgi:outer membrane translocation and assembly module TamA
MGNGFGARTSILGYFVRADYAWGFEDKEINKPILHISIGHDF